MFIWTEEYIPKRERSGHLHSLLQNLPGTLLRFQAVLGRSHRRLPSSGVFFAILNSLDSMIRALNVAQLLQLTLDALTISRQKCTKPRALFMSIFSVTA